jgi:hypothetical protein
MFQARTLRRVSLLAVAVGLIAVGPAVPQVREKIRDRRAQLKTAPKLEAVADTRLLMDGINLPNFQGMEGLLKQKPADAETWTFLRGQALLIAENGNLLLLRPPRNDGEDIWMDRAVALRTTATKLARAAADKNYEACRAGLWDLADTCNRCHKSFRAGVQIRPFAAQEPGKGLQPRQPATPPAPKAPPRPQPPAEPPPARIPPG